MRPLFRDSEVRFLLDLLREVAENKRVQTDSLREEETQLRQLTIPSLVRQFRIEGYSQFKELKQAKLLLSITQGVIPSCANQQVMLDHLVNRMEKLLSKRRGRLKFTSPYVNSVLSIGTEKQTK